MGDGSQWFPECSVTPAIAIEGIVNFATREGVRLYTSASQKLEEEQYDCKPEGFYISSYSP
jgi:hypothetical protein